MATKWTKVEAPTQVSIVGRKKPLICTLQSSIEVSGKFGPETRYLADLETGERVELLPVASMNRQLKQIPTGSKIKIEYLGSEATTLKDGTAGSRHIASVFVAE